MLIQPRSINSAFLHTAHRKNRRAGKWGVSGSVAACLMATPQEEQQWQDDIGDDSRES
jgi:hypothetical protein